MATFGRLSVLHITMYSGQSWPTDSENIGFIVAAIIVFELWPLKSPIVETLKLLIGQIKWFDSNFEKKFGFLVALSFIIHIHNLRFYFFTDI